MDLRFVELAKSARILVEEIFHLKEGENFLILTDTRAPEALGFEPFIMALSAEVQAAGAELMVMTYVTREEAGAALPKAVVGAIRSADAVMSLVTMQVTSSPSIGEARADGHVRMCVFTSGKAVGQANPMVYNILPKTREEALCVVETSKKLEAAIPRGYHKIHLTTAKGTDLWLEVGDFHMFYSSGLVDEPGKGETLPGGATVFGINYGSAHGTIVVDGIIAGIEGMLTDPIVMTVENGFVTDITGGSQAMEFKSIIDSRGTHEAYHVSEFGLGFHPSFRIPDSENTYGAAHIGIGANNGFGGTNFAGGFHADSVISAATVEVDGELIVKDGEFLI